jgi:hypothetical protein
VGPFIRPKDSHTANVALVIPKEYAGDMLVFDDVMPDSDVPPNAISVSSRLVEILVIPPHGPILPDQSVVENSDYTQ